MMLVGGRPFNERVKEKKKKKKIIGTSTSILAHVGDTSFPSFHPQSHTLSLFLLFLFIAMT